jgi:transposase
MSDLIVGLYEDWLWLDERIETVTREIEAISQKQEDCRRLMSIPGIGPMISTAMVTVIGEGDAFERGRDFGAWLGLVPRQYSTDGRSILGGISKRGSRYLVSLRRVPQGGLWLRRLVRDPTSSIPRAAIPAGGFAAFRRCGRARQPARREDQYR